jgi:hypothetical protein
MKKFVLILLLFFTKSLVSGKDLYVKQGNSNSNNGLTPATAVGITPTGLFPNAFLATVQPGDVIHLIGTFTNPSYSTTITMSTPVDDPRFWHGENTLRINNLNGAAGNYITIKAYDNTTVLKGDGGNIFRIQNSSYLKIEGFDIQGEVDNLPLALANQLQFVYVVSTSTVTDPTPAQIRYRDQDCVSNCTAGAVVDGEVYTSINPNQVYRPTYYDTRAMYLSDVHHIDILNNHMHHMPGGGLRVSDCEDILIQGNEINDCSRRSSGGTHGLVVTKATSTRTTDDYRIRIIANKVHHNYNEQYSWAPDKTIITPHIDEGKGISLQRNQTVGGTNPVDWNNGRILIANNICYYNGFSGIHSNDGFRIDIINNSCYFNSYTGSITIGGTNPNGGNIGISLQGGTGHKIINNICVIDNNMTRSPLSTDITTVGGVIVRNNVIYGTTGSVGTDSDIDAVQVNTRMVNPQFKNPSLNEFDLLSTSPAINQADASYATTIPELTKDYYGNIRMTPDIGAIEYISSLPVELLDFSLAPQQTAIHLFWQTASEKNNKGFDVERSKEGDSWQKIGMVKGNNNTKTLQKYAFIDSEPLQGVNYYRLKQVDTEGPFSYSKTLSATIKTKNTLLVYPNPFTQTLWIEGVTQGDRVEIFDAVGRQVSTVKVETAVDNRFEINTSFLSPHSLYFLKIGEQVTKIVKN